MRRRADGRTVGTAGGPGPAGAPAATGVPPCSRARAAALLALAAGLLASAQARGQAGEELVSNLDQDPSSSLTGGTVYQRFRPDNQAFSRLGSSSYILTGVRIATRSDEAPSFTVTVHVVNESTGALEHQVAALTAPSSIPATGVAVFTAPPGTDLSAFREYAVRIAGAAGVSTTDAGDEDGAAGWSIADGRGASDDGSPVRMAIVGYSWNFYVGNRWQAGVDSASSARRAQSFRTGVGEGRMLTSVEIGHVSGDGDYGAALHEAGEDGAPGRLLAPLAAADDIEAGSRVRFEPSTAAYLSPETDYVVVVPGEHDGEARTLRATASDDEDDGSGDWRLGDAFHEEGSDSSWSETSTGHALSVVVRTHEADPLVRNYSEADAAIVNYGNAQSFRTGPEPALTVAIEVAVQRAAPGAHSVLIRADGGGSPGALVAVLDDIGRTLGAGFDEPPGTSQAYPFAVRGGPLVLRPETTYWVTVNEAHPDTTTSPAEITVAQTASDNEDGEDGWTVGDVMQRRFEEGETDSELGWHVAPGDSNALQIGVLGEPFDPTAVAEDATVKMRADETHAFAAADFPFSGPYFDSELESVTVASLPARGTLSLDGTAVAAGDKVTRAQLDAGQFTYAPDSSGRDATFDFRVTADGERGGAATMRMQLVRFVVSVEALQELVGNGLHDVSFRFSVEVLAGSTQEGQLDDVRFRLSQTQPFLSAALVRGEVVEYDPIIRFDADGDGFDPHTQRYPWSEFDVWVEADGELTVHLEPDPRYVIGTPEGATVAVTGTEQVGWAYFVDQQTRASEHLETNIRADPRPDRISWGAVIEPGYPPPDRPLAFDLYTTDGEAVAPDDYEAVAETLEFQRGDWEETDVVGWNTTPPGVGLRIVDDRVREPDETFHLRLEGPPDLPPTFHLVHGFGGARCPEYDYCEATITIVDDDAPPELRSATAAGTTLTLTYNQDLNPLSVPAAGAFAVWMDGARASVAAVAVAGRTVTLTLSAAVSPGDRVTVDYAVPTGDGARPIRNADGHAAEAFNGVVAAAGDIHFPGSATRSLTENSPAGTLVGEPVAAEHAGGDALAYELGGADADAFDIDAATGQLSAKAGVAYDYEAKASYSVAVTASGGGDSASVTVAVALVDLPAVSIAAARPAFQVTDPAVRFEVSSTPAPPDGLAVDVTGAQGARTWFAGSLARTLSAAGGAWPDAAWEFDAGRHVSEAAGGEFTATLAPGSPALGYELGTASATVPVFGADPMATVRPARAVVAAAEGGAAAVAFVAESAAGAPRPPPVRRVRVSTEADSATAGADYAALPDDARLAFEAADFARVGTGDAAVWRAEKRVSVPILDDDEREDEERLRVVLARDGSATHRLAALRAADGSACGADGCYAEIAIADGPAGGPDRGAELVSNLEQAEYLTLNNVLFASQAFETGPSSGGWAVTGVRLQVRRVSGGEEFTASLYTVNAIGRPVDEVAALTAPDSFPENGVAEFTAPAGTALAAATTYAVRTGELSTGIGIRTTLSTAQDTGAAAGWSIADSSVNAPGADRPLMIAVDGHPRFGTGWAVRNLGQANTTVAATARRAQAFTTGPNPSGYVLEAAAVAYRDAEGDRFALTLHAADADGEPGAEIAALAPPAAFAADAPLRFAAPGTGVGLAAETTYALVATPADAAAPVDLGGTASDDEDAGASPGWSIADGHRVREDSDWEENSASLRIGVLAAAQAGLVSNLGETPGGDTGWINAQRFLTGASGARVSAVRLLTEAAGETDTTAVAIRADADGAPGALVAALDNPEAIAEDAVNRFAAPDGPVGLRPRTHYWVTVNEGVASGDRVRFVRTESDDETGEAGWTIADDVRARASGGGEWLEVQEALMVSLDGVPFDGATAEASDASVTVPADAPYAFAAADFGFRGAYWDSALSAVVVESLPALGILSLDGTAVASGQRVSRADLDAGLLTYRTAADASTAMPYATFMFRVAGDGTRSASAYSMALNVPELATIAADRDVIGYGLHEVEFTVTLTRAPAEDVTVPLALEQTQAFLADDDLAGPWTVTVAAGETEGTVRISESELRPLRSGVTADGELTMRIQPATGWHADYAAGSPGAATVAVRVEGRLVAVALDRASWTVAEGATQSVGVTARTAEGVPAPGLSLTYAFDTLAGTASVEDDYESISLGPAFGPADWTESGGRFVARHAHDLEIVDDDVAEPAESLELRLVNTPGQARGVHMVDADGTLCPRSDGCRATVTIPMNDLTAWVSGNEVTLLFAVELDEDSVPPASAFSVSVEGGTAVVPTAVSVSGRTVTLTFLNAVATPGQAVTVDYTPPTGDDVDVLQDTDGDALGALSGWEVGAAGALVSNLNQAAGQDLGEGTHWQLFRTGPNPAGYVVTGVRIAYGDVSGPRAGSASIRTADVFGAPDVEVAALTSPSSVAAGETAGYAAPAGTVLRPNTEYAVRVADSSGVSQIEGKRQDDGAAPGWMMARTSHGLDIDDRPLRIAVDGLIPPANVAFASAAASREVAEDSAAGTAVGDPVTATDRDGDTLTYTLGGADAAPFAIDRATGQISTAAALDHETKSSHEVEVTASDGGNNATATVTIEVTDVEEQPATPAAPAVAVNAGSRTSLDASWTEPARNGGPAIAGYDVQYRACATLRCQGAEDGDWSDHAHAGTATAATIGGLTEGADYQVRVRALNGETPSAWSESGAGRAGVPNRPPAFADAAEARTVPENTPAGGNVGAPLPEAIDPDGDTPVYTLEGFGTSPPAILWRITGTQITVAAPLDFESRSAYEVTLKADDLRGGTATLPVALTVADVDEQPETPAAPTVTAPAGTASMLEAAWTEPGRNGGPAIAGYEVQYREAGGGAWSDHAHGGTETAATIGGLAASTDYQVRVRALNGETPSAWSQPGAGRTGDNAVPVFEDADVVFALEENSPPGTAVGTVAATDPEGDPVTHALEGDGAADFRIDAGTGAIATAPCFVPDRESIQSKDAAGAGYDLTVRADDGDGGVATAAVRIEIGDVEPEGSALVRAVVRGAALTLTFERALDAQRRPAAGSFAVTADGAAAAVSGVRIAGRKAVLTLAAPVGEGQAVALDYNPPAADALRDADGPVPLFACAEALNVTGDDKPPALSAATVTGTELELLYDEGLDEDGTPAASAYAVRVDGAPAAVASVRVDGRRVRLTLEELVRQGQAVTLDYVPPATGAVLGLDGHEAAALSGVEVENQTAALGALRLVDGPDGSDGGEGRLEMFVNRFYTGDARDGGGHWGTVCDDHFLNGTAGRACRMLGFEGGAALGGGGGYRTAPYGQPGLDLDAQRIVLDDVRCDGERPGDAALPGTSLLSCRHAGLGVHNCRHAEDVGLRCRGDFAEPPDRLGPTLTDIELDSDGLGMVFTFHEDLSGADGLRVGNDPERHILYLTRDGHKWRFDVDGRNRGLFDAPGEGGLLGNQFRVHMRDSAWDDKGEGDEVRVGIRVANDDAWRTDVRDAAGNGAPVSHRIPTMVYTVLEHRDIRVLGGESGEGRTVTFRVRLEDNGPGAAQSPAGAAAEGPEIPARASGKAAAAARTDSAGGDAKDPAERNRGAVPGGARAVAEAAGRVVRSAAAAARPDGQVTVDYATEDGTATAGEDYEAVSGTLTFAAGETEKTVEVALLDDGDDEDDETFSLVLSRARGAALADDGTAQATVADDEEPALSAADARGVEGGTAAFEVALEPAASDAVAVDYATSDGTATAGEDYEAASGTLTFAAGETEKTVEVALLDDGDDEDDETFSLALSGAEGALVADGEATGTVEDDDGPPPALSAADARGAEGGAAAFAVTLDRASAWPAAVDYATEDGTATAGEDYEAVSGTLTFAPGETGKTVEVALLDDEADEADETFSLVLSGASGAAVADGAATGTVEDDDEAALAVADARGAEGGEAVFEVALDRPAASVVTVNYATSDGTAVAGEDYEAVSGTLAFAAGDIEEKRVEVALLGDASAEGDETFTLALSGAVGAAVADAEATGTVENEDVSVAFVSVPAAHDGSSKFLAVFEFGARVRARSSWVEDTLVTVSNGTVAHVARRREEDTSATTRWEVAVHPASMAAVVLTLTPGLALDDGRDLDVGAPATVPGPPAFRVADARGPEGGAAAFAVTLDPAAAETATVDYATADGTAEAGKDYEAASGTLTFAAGETEKTVSVALVDDDRAEVEETFALNLSGAAGAPLADGEATGAIEDDDRVAAAFASVPAEHDGASPFEFGLEFSEHVADLSYVFVEETLVTASNGTVESAWRQAPPSNVGWNVRVEPASAADVVLRLTPGLTLDDGRALLVGDPETVAGPAGAGDPVAVAFTSVPAAHDGEAAFEAALEFGEDVEGVSPAWVRDTLVAATNATVAGASRRAPPSNAGWNVRVEPASSRDVVLSLTPGLVLDDGRAVAAGDPATVPGPPEASVADARGPEGGTAAFAVTLDAAAAETATVDYASEDGTATAGEDYEAVSGTLAFAPGETAKTVEVALLDDAADEDDETFALVLTGAAVGDGRATGTVEDDDVSVAFAAVPAEHDGATAFEAELGFGEQAPGLQAEWVRDTLVTASNGTVESAWPRGIFSANWFVRVEPASSADVVLTLTPGLTLDGGGALVVGDPATVAGPPWALSVADAVGAEGETAAFAVTLDGAAAAEVTVAYATADGTAVAVEDYEAAEGTLAFAPGETEKTVEVALTDDAVVEEEETFTLVLSDAAGAAVADAEATGTVEDDDVPEFSLAAEPAQIAEGETATVTLSIGNGVSYAAAREIALAVSGEAGTSDYRLEPAVLTLEAGADSATATFEALRDLADEGPETATVTARLGEEELGSATVRVDDVAVTAVPTISGVVQAGATLTAGFADEAAPAELSHQWLRDGEAVAGATEAAYALSAADAGSPVSVRVEDAGGAGLESAATIPVWPAARRAELSEDEESLLETTLTLGSRRSPVRIAGHSAVEGREFGSLDEASFDLDGEDRRVALYAVGGESEGFVLATEPAIASADGLRAYWDEHRIADFEPGGNAGGMPTWTAPTPQPEAESDRYLWGDSDGVRVAVSLRREKARVSVADAEASEGGAAGLSFAVTLDRAAAERVTVDYATVDGTAVAGWDYGAASGTLTFAAGETEKTVEVSLLDDAADEADETLELVLSDPAGALLGEERATGTILDDDEPGALPTLSASDASGVEGGAAAFAVALDGAAAAAATVDYATADGTAVAGADYESASGTLTFGAGETEKTVEVSLLDDAVDEGDETFALVLSGASRASLADAEATGTVEDDDEARFSLMVTPSVVAEGATATVRVSVADATFADARDIALAVTGEVAASDYALGTETLPLPAGGISAETTLEALRDEEDESAETGRVAATLGGVEVAHAAVTLRDASSDATLSDLALSDVDIGVFDAGTTAYEGETSPDVESTTVEATPADANAAVEIADAAGTTAGTERTSALSTGLNEIEARVTAEDGATARTYRVEVTRPPAWGERLPDRDVALEGSGTPGGVWSDGETLWAQGYWHGAAVQAYVLATGARDGDRDLRIRENRQHAALWSDGETLWASSYWDGALEAYRLSDGARPEDEDPALAGGNRKPVGVWSDGETRYVLDYDDARAYAYGSDWGRLEDDDLELAGGGWPWGLWSDGETLLTSWYAEGTLRAYRLADGERLAERDIDAGAAGNGDPRDMWSDGETLWVLDGEDRKLYAYAAPGLRRPADGSVDVSSRAAPVPSADPGPPVRLPDANLRARVAAALGKGPDAEIGERELLALEALDARDAGVRDLTGLERAANLAALDLGGNPLEDVRALSLLPRLEALNADGTGLDPWSLSGLDGLRRLSLRDNGLTDLGGLAGLARLEELDIGGNWAAELWPLSGLARLRILRADGNGIEDVLPLAELTALEALDLRGNRVEDATPLRRLPALRRLDLGGNPAELAGAP